MLQLFNILLLMLFLQLLGMLELIFWLLGFLFCAVITDDTDRYFL